MKTIIGYSMFAFSAAVCLSGCDSDQTKISAKSIEEINLKRGDIISCSPGKTEFGTLEFMTSCNAKAKEDFNTGVKLLHSFEYEEAEKMFAKVIDEEPECAMAYWGVAMSNFHPLWSPATPDELRKGNKAIEIARLITNKTKREEAYINAVAMYYTNWETIDHRTRCLKFEQAMNDLHTTNPDDNEATIFYALSLVAAADPSDKTYAKQKEAGNILNTLYVKSPNHPGVVHYIIHTFDTPELATLALPAARKYAAVAPSSAHALHMPSHIFTRLGLWNESVQSNLSSVASAKCYVEAAGIKGHWDEELHGLDYLVYSYLQNGDNAKAKQQVDYMKTVKEVYPANFKIAYAFSSIPARYALENKLWQQAADLQFQKANFDWQNYPWEKAVTHFARVLGCVNTGNLLAAQKELDELQQIYKRLSEQKDIFKANKVLVQIKTSEAWILFKQGKNSEAIQVMQTAADLEDKTGKHPVTPGDVLPAREVLGDMLLQMNKPSEALNAYKSNLKTTPNRFNGVYGACIAAEKLGNKAESKLFYQQLIKITQSSNSNRPELISLKKMLG
jgi:tetratricopeptide (TPR) repeat protein